MIKSFTDLNAWKKSHELVIGIYRITKQFPKEEQFGLTSQIRRAAVPITSNIAEGFSRHSNKDRIHFYHMSLGSLTEVQSQLIIARDIKYVNTEEIQKLAEQSVVASKLINGLIKHLKSRKS